MESSFLLFLGDTSIIVIIDYSIQVILYISGVLFFSLPTLAADPRFALLYKRERERERDITLKNMNLLQLFRAKQSMKPLSYFGLKKKKKIATPP